jgi:hypothetical protein
VKINLLQTAIKNIYLRFSDLSGLERGIAALLWSIPSLLDRARAGRFEMDTFNESVCVPIVAG